MAIEIILLFVATILLYNGFILFLLNAHAKEKQQLLNRIMAKDYQEYISFKEDNKPTASRNFLTKYQNDYKNNKNNKLKFYSEAGDE